MRNIKILNHTADIGVEIRAKSLRGVFNLAVRAIIGLCLQKSSGHEIRRNVRFKGDSAEELLHDFLNEILYNIFVKKKYVKSAIVKNFSLKNMTLSAVMHINPDKKTGDYIIEELKSVTYNSLALKKNKGYYETKIIIDV